MRGLIDSFIIKVIKACREYCSRTNTGNEDNKFQDN